MTASPPPCGRYRCALSEAHKKALLGGTEARSVLQQEVARQFLEGVTWIIDLREDGAFESVWHVEHAEPMPPISGTWEVDAQGALRLAFVDEPAWPGTLTAESLRFTHPEVGAVEMARVGDAG